MATGLRCNPRNADLADELEKTAMGVLDAIMFELGGRQRQISNSAKSFVKSAFDVGSVKPDNLDWTSSNPHPNDVAGWRDEQGIPGEFPAARIRCAPGSRPTAETDTHACAKTPSV